MTEFLQRAARPAIGRAAGALVVLAVLLVGFGVGAAQPVPRSSPMLVHAATDWLRYDTGRVSVVFPTPTPDVTLIQDANASVQGQLSVAQILEVAPGSSTIVAAAFPPEVSGFNGSHPLSSSSWPVSLSAHLNVYPAAPLSPTGHVVHPATPAVGVAQFSVSYSLVSAGAPGDGVEFAWSVGGWPWVSPADVLALEFSFTPAASARTVACSAATTLSGGTGCQGSSVPAGGLTWTPGVVGLESDSATGPTASVSWSSSVTVSDVGPVPASVATYTTAPGSADVVIGASGQGAESMSGAVDFAIIAPLPAVPIPVSVHGNGPVYGVAVLAFALVAVGGIAAYRRFERRVTDAL